MEFLVGTGNSTDTTTKRRSRSPSRNYNRPLAKDRAYRVFLRAYTTDSVSILYTHIGLIYSFIICVHCVFVLFYLCACFSSRPICMLFSLPSSLQRPSSERQSLRYIPHPNFIRIRQGNLVTVRASVCLSVCLEVCISLPVFRFISIVQSRARSVSQSRGF